MSGAFDKLGPHRAALMSSLEDALKAADQHAKAEAIGQSGYVWCIGRSPRAKWNVLMPMYLNGPDQVVLEGERETLGFIFNGTSHHPLSKKKLNDMRQEPV